VGILHDGTTARRHDGHKGPEEGVGIHHEGTKDTKKRKNHVVRKAFGFVHGAFVLFVSFVPSW